MIAAATLAALEKNALANRRVRAITALVALAGAAFLLGRCTGGHGVTPIPVAEAHSLDSLLVTAPLFAVAVAATRSETVYVREATRQAASAATSLLSADSLAHVADSLSGLAAAQHDTASTWRRVALTRQQEADTARVAATTWHLAFVAATTARVQADARAALDSARLVGVTDLNTRIAADLRAADPPCRVLFLHCASRKVSLVTGLAVGALAAVRLHFPL